jgi:hypothetical protein
MKALEGSREGKGQAACTVLYSCTAYITSQQVSQLTDFFKHSQDYELLNLD